MAQDTYRVKHYLREQGQRWVLTEAVGLGAVCEDADATGAFSARAPAVDVDAQP